MTEVITDQQIFACRVCNNANIRIKGDICDNCLRKYFRDGTLTLSNTSKVLGISVATLKKLEKDGILIPVRNDAGSRIYERSKVIEYISNKKSYYTPHSQVPNLIEKVIQLELTESNLKIDDRCDRCYENKMFRMGYCKNCLDDFISKKEAGKILGVSPQLVERVVENHPDKVHLFEYGSQVRLSRKEVAEFSGLDLNMKDAVKAAWSDHFLQCRTCGTTDVPHYGGGYCEDCFPNTTEAAVIEGYIDGENLSEVGIRLGFSRERSRQFFEKAIRIEAERTDPENVAIVITEFKKKLKETNKQNRSLKQHKSFIDEHYQEIVKRLTSENVLAASTMLKLFNLPANALRAIESDYPELLQIIARNVHRWAWDYDACRMCGTTEVKHQVYGYCKNCYWKSDEWKHRQNEYRQRNVDKIREQQRQYNVEYNKRPEVVARLKQRHDAVNYEGNRDIALKNANYSCEECGISQLDHQNTYKKELHVYRLDGDQSNNDLTNLKVLCMSCAVKRTRSKQLANS